MRRVTAAFGLASLLLLAGCASGPDLLQCQAVAELDTELEAFFDADNAEAGTGGAEEQLQQLGELADAYSEVEVDGDLKEATSSVGDKLNELLAYRIAVQDGDAPDPAREKELRREAIDAFVNMQTICIEANAS
ncbi:hypothetical protein [Microbacterium sp. BLY]|uniref:hypothetical protein n=1 Tax=Microbacterium sp. BLY TaxID=2823280 RepID=UPI001B341809|nr:hypothetical protein [Microbacterium sp. BLY]MBP3977008.1 hypothetical protein [Microbacterium sp. BLY]